MKDLAGWIPNHCLEMFIVLTSGFIQIGAENLGAEFGGSQRKADISLAGGITFLRPSRTNLSPLSENAKVRLAAVVLSALGTISISALMLMALSSAL